jgi:hypothetical protein
VFSNVELFHTFTNKKNKLFYGTKKNTEIRTKTAGLASGQIKVPQRGKGQSVRTSETI